MGKTRFGEVENNKYHWMGGGWIKHKERSLKKLFTIQYNTIQYNTIQYNTIQYNTIQLYLRAITFSFRRALCKKMIKNKIHIIYSQICRENGCHTVFIIYYSHFR